MNPAPTTPLAVVVEALRAAERHGSINSSHMAHGGSDRPLDAETAARALLAKLAATAKGERAGTVAHFEGNGPSVTGVIWVGTKPEPGTAVYLAAPGPGGAEWLPIESAPEDTDVLGYFPDAWHKVRRFRKYTRTGGVVWTIETQSFSDPGSRLPHDKLPTHWTKLLPPPSAQLRNTGGEQAERAEDQQKSEDSGEDVDAGRELRGHRDEVRDRPSDEADQGDVDE